MISVRAGIGALVLIFGSIPLPGSFFEVSFYVLAIVLGIGLFLPALQVLMIRRIPAPSGIALVFLSLAIIGTLGALWNPDIGRVIKEFGVFAYPVLFYAILRVFWEVSPEGGHSLAALLVFVIGFLTVVQLALYIPGYLNFESRFLFRKDYVLLSTQILVLFPLVVQTVRRPKYRFLFAAGAIVCLALTLSREVSLFLFLLLTFTMAQRLGHGVTKIFLLSLTLFPVIYFVVVVASSLSVASDASANWRFLEVISVFMSLDLESLTTWFGNGFGSYIHMSSGIPINGKIVTELPRFHNIWLYFIFKFGLLGAMSVWASAIWVAVQANLRNQSVGIVVFLYIYLMCVSGSFWGLFTMSAASCVVLAVLLWFYDYSRVATGKGNRSIPEISTPMHSANISLTRTNKAES